MKYVIFSIIVIATISLVFPFVYAQSVPDWVKNTAGWWSTDAISEREFVNAIEFLVNVGIINVNYEDTCIDDFINYFSNKEKIVEVCEKYNSVVHDELIPYDIDIKLNSKGFRGPEFSDEKPLEVYRIILVGGSTMYGESSTIDTTIPGILQKIFDSKNLDFEVEIINAGISGGNTKTEFELIKTKLVNYNPDLIIMFDGWNDLSADFSVMKIINNYELICSTAIENEFEVIMTLQPIAGFGDKSLTKQEKINSITGKDHRGFQLIQAKSTYDYLEREMKNLDEIVKREFGGVCSTYDLRGIFDDVSGPIYWDQGHLMQGGNFILAEKFFELAIKKIDPTITVDDKIKKLISKYNSIPVISFLLSEINVSVQVFESPLREFSDTSSLKGKYFELKEKFDGKIENIYVGKDLRDVDLTDVDFQDQDLTGANLSGHDLRDVDLTDTIIQGADLSYTNLESKSFSGMNVIGVDFSYSNLENSDFKGAILAKPIQLIENGCTDLEPTQNKIKNYKCSIEVIKNEKIRTKFVGAKLTSAEFGGDKSFQAPIFFVDFRNANLEDVSIKNADISNNFTNTSLNGMILKDVTMINTDMSNVKMKNFVMENIWIQSSSFIDSELMDGVMRGIVLINNDFTNTDFEGTQIEEIFSSNDNKYGCKNHDICE